MKKTDRSPDSKKSKDHSEFSRVDKLALIKEVRQTMDNFDYATVSAFREATELVAAAFWQGRRLPGHPFDEVLPQLIRFARRSKSADAVWFATWVKRVYVADSERLSSRQRERSSIDAAKETLKKLTVEIEDFGYASASDIGPECYLGSLAGFYHIFSDSGSLRAFALDLMNAATQIESSRIVIQPTLVPEGYAETVLADWSDQIVANAWLYPDRTDGEGDGNG